MNKIMKIMNVILTDDAVVEHDDGNRFKIAITNMIIIKIIIATINKFFLNRLKLKKKQVRSEILPIGMQLEREITQEVLSIYSKKKEWLKLKPFIPRKNSKKRDKLNRFSMIKSFMKFLNFKFNLDFILLVPSTVVSEFRKDSSLPVNLTGVEGKLMTEAVLLFTIETE